MKIVVAIVAFVVMAAGSTGIAATLTVPATPVHADADPNVPNLAANYCPGGRQDDAYTHRCIGTKYPDGSYWRDSQYSIVNWTPDNVSGRGLRCVIDYGPNVVAAPPGGCNGAV